MEEREPAAVDALFAEALRAGESRARAREALVQALDEQVLAATLRRAVPVAFLEEVAAGRPWSERPRVLARVVLSPRAPQALSLRLVSGLYWRDLAEVAATPRVPAAVRARAESLLRDGLPDMRLGDRVTLARLATPALLPASARGRRAPGRGIDARKPAPAGGGPRRRAAAGRRRASRSSRRWSSRRAGRRTTPCGSRSCCSRARRFPSRCSRSARSCRATCGAWPRRRRCAPSSGRQPGRSSKRRRTLSASSNSRWLNEMHLTGLRRAH